MTEYQIQAPTRTCSATGRELKVGERYFSVLLEEAGKFVRKDFSEEAWECPPAGAFGFWQGRLTAGAPRRPVIDDDLLLECFARLAGEDEPSKAGFRYVITLLLVRRKRFRLEETKGEKGQEGLTVRCARTGARHFVPDPGLSDSEIESVQDDVFRALGWEA